MSEDLNTDRAIVAFSGGLDTSMLVPYMREKYDLKHVTACFVDTGGAGEEEKQAVQKRAEEVQADEYIYIDGSQAFYDEIIKYLIFGQVSRDGYPLCVGAERLIQAREVMKTAREKGISLIAHGSTGAGNDQYRFDLAVYVLGQGERDIRAVAPVREHGLTREFSQKFLAERQISVPEKSKYSYNAGLWGVSVGGQETHSAEGLIPEEAWYSKIDPALERAEIEIDFESGEPVALRHEGDEIKGPLSVIKKLAATGGAMGIGRHYHVGTSIPGKKGRLAYESPAADILYAAHGMLEKHVMTQAQISFKKGVAQEFGRLIHEARFFDPLIEDLQAYLESSQKRVSGTCRVKLLPGRIESVTADTPYDLLTAGGSLYGEHADFYDAADAEGSSKLNAYEQVIYHGLGKK